MNGFKRNIFPFREFSHTKLVISDMLTESEGCMEKADSVFNSGYIFNKPYHHCRIRDTETVTEFKSRINLEKRQMAIWGIHNEKGGVVPFLSLG